MIIFPKKQKLFHILPKCLKLVSDEILSTVRLYFNTPWNKDAMSKTCVNFNNLL